MEVINWNTETLRPDYIKAGLKTDIHPTLTGIKTGTLDVIVGKKEKPCLAGGEIKGLSIIEIIEERPAKGFYKSNRPTWQRLKVAYVC